MRLIIRKSLQRLVLGLVISLIYSADSAMICFPDAPIGDQSREGVRERRLCRVHCMVSCMVVEPLVGIADRGVVREPDSGRSSHWAPPQKRRLLGIHGIRALAVAGHRGPEWLNLVEHVQAPSLHRASGFFDEFRRASAGWQGVRRILRDVGMPMLRRRVLWV